jgi:hypothetical protein
VWSYYSAGISVVGASSFAQVAWRPLGWPTFPPIMGILRGRNRRASRVCSPSVKESYSSSFTASVAQYSHEWLLR